MLLVGHTDFHLALFYTIRTVFAPGLCLYGFELLWSCQCSAKEEVFQFVIRACYSISNWVCDLIILLTDIAVMSVHASSHACVCVRNN